MAGLPSTRIVTATEVLNQIVNDIRDAPGVPKDPQRTIWAPPPAKRDPPSLDIQTAGKILRGLKIER
jgi:hypothetical protein